MGGDEGRGGISSLFLGSLVDTQQGQGGHPHVGIGNSSLDLHVESESKRRYADNKQKTEAPS